MTTAPWHTDADLAGRFHPQHPDDLEVMVHDGEPRRTQRMPESCWVRVQAQHGVLRFPNMPSDAALPFAPERAQWLVRAVYRGTLLNQPAHLTGTQQGSTVLFVYSPGMPHPLQVTETYLAERPGWAFASCNACGADQALDPPTAMAKTRFPDAPAGSVPVAFTAFCPCKGTMMLAMVEGATAAEALATKPWWKFW